MVVVEVAIEYSYELVQLYRVGECRNNLIIQPFALAGAGASGML